MNKTELLGVGEGTCISCKPVELPMMMMKKMETKAPSTSGDLVGPDVPLQPFSTASALTATLCPLRADCSMLVHLLLHAVPHSVGNCRYKLVGNKSFDSLFLPEKQSLINLLDQFMSREVHCVPSIRNSQINLPLYP